MSPEMIGTVEALVDGILIAVLVAGFVGVVFAAGLAAWCVHDHERRLRKEWERVYREPYPGPM